MNKSRKRIEYLNGDKVANAIFINEIQPAMLHGSIRRRANFKCNCGNEFIQFINNVVKGESDHCGCKIINKKKFDKTNKSEYHIYCNMRQRCYNTKSKSYPSYGGRGIIMCDRWLESFENFYEDIGARPSIKHTIDRINNDGIYEKGNCRWATTKQQNRNKRSNRMVTYNGKTMCVADWCDLYQMDRTAFAKRLDSGMSISKAMAVNEKFKRKDKRREETILSITFSKQK